MAHTHLRGLVLVNRAIARQDSAHSFQVVVLLDATADRCYAFLALGLQIGGLIGRHPVKLPIGGGRDLCSLDGLLQSILSTFLAVGQIWHAGSKFSSSSFYFVSHLAHLLSSFEKPLLSFFLVKGVLVGIIAVANLLNPIGVLLRLLDAVVAPSRLPVPFDLIENESTSFLLFHVPFLHELLPPRFRLLLGDGLRSRQSKDSLCRERDQSSFIALVSGQCEELVHKELNRVSGVGRQISSRGNRRDIIRSHVFEVINQIVFSRCGRRSRHRRLFGTRHDAKRL
mmetsp:Transcript_14123/g.31262  ORF Transcript_14123/g.31262 Transcript_14123/m.31262 type:complete len:283 (+) Transcript_14123:198-1046(+)